MSEYAGTCPICGDTCDQESLDKFERLQAELREARIEIANRAHLEREMAKQRDLAEADREGFMNGMHIANAALTQVTEKNAELIAQGAISKEANLIERQISVDQTVEIDRLTAQVAVMKCKIQDIHQRVASWGEPHKLPSHTPGHRELLDTCNQALSNLPAEAEKLA